MENLVLEKEIVKVEETSNDGVQTEQTDLKETALVKEAPASDVDEVKAAEVPLTRMRKHRLNFMRLMNQEEHDALNKSMMETYDGENFPIIVVSDGTLDSNGEKLYDEIVDGYNSYLMTQELGLVPVFKKVDWTDEQILQHVVRASTRRNLSPSDAAFIVVRYEMMHRELEAEAKAKSANNLKKGNETPDSPKKDIRKDSGRTDDKVAKKLHVKTSKTTIGKAKNAVKKDPDLFRKMDSGEISSEEAIRTKKKAPEQPAPKDDNADPSKKPDHKTPFKPVPTEKTLTVIVEKAKRKVIDLQKERSNVGKKVVAVGRLIKEHADNSKQLAEDNKQRDDLIHESDSFKLEIKKSMNELSSQLIFQCQYKQAESDNFKGKIAL